MKEKHTEPVWDDETGTYIHSCKNCNKQFSGRRNMQYCSMLCKNKIKADVARTKRKSIADLTNGYLKNIRILNLLYDQYPIGKRIPIAMLNHNGFAFDAPYTPAFDEDRKIDMMKYGEFMLIMNTDETIEIHYEK